MKPRRLHNETSFSISMASILLEVGEMRKSLTGKRLSVPQGSLGRLRGSSVDNWLDWLGRLP